MNLARGLRPLRRSVPQNIYRNYKTSATNYESTPSTQPQVQEEKFSFEDVKVLERVERRKPKILPFMKECYISKFNRELLAYPEILDKEESKDLDNRVARLDSIFKNPDATENEREKAILDVGLFSAPLNLTMNGLAMNITERIRYLETLSSDVVLGKKLSDHWVGLSVVMKGLSENKFNELLPDLNKGDFKIGLCMKERIPTRVNQRHFTATAKLDNHGVWRLHGEKMCSSQSGFYVVLALRYNHQIAAFLVTPNSQGIEYSSPYITFRDTPALPLDNVPTEALFSMLGLTRLDTAVLCYSLLKNILLKTVEYVRGKFINGLPLAEASTIKARVGQALLSVYAAESMAYFTAGLLDGYHDPDADMEVAMCRCFTTETCYNSLHQLLMIPGLESAENTTWTTCLNLYRNLSVHDEMIDNINLFTAMNAIQYAGKNMATEIQQLRNPLFHPTYILKKVFANRHQDSDNPKLTLRLCEHLHPSLRIPSDSVEYCVLRLRYACETLLHRHGKDITAAYTELDRLAQAGTQILAMSAVLARASRSYCIGLRNGEIEMKLASCFVDSSKVHTRKLINELIDGEYLNLDRFKIDFGKKVLDTNSVLVEKATEHVFW